MRTRMQEEIQSKDVQAVLPNDVNAALRELIRLTTRLVDFADIETQALVKNDHLAFAYAQKDKEKFAAHYSKASEEFRARVEEFRGCDQRLLLQLDQKQSELREKTMSNNVVIDQVKTRASANTQATLFSAQEIGQRVRFADDAPDPAARGTAS